MIKWSNSIMFGWNTKWYGNTGNIVLEIEEVISLFLFYILANNKSLWNWKSNTMICQLIPKIIVSWSIVITGYHWECSKVTATTVMIFFLIDDLFLKWTGRWPWFACWDLISIAMLLLCIRTIPPNHPISFQANNITSWNFNIEQYLVTDFGDDIWANVLHGEFVLIYSSIGNGKISFCILENAWKLKWRWKQR